MEPFGLSNQYVQVRIYDLNVLITDFNIMLYSVILELPLLSRPGWYPARLRPVRCVQMIKHPYKGGRGMSTNNKGCYDKLDRAIVAVSRLDDCTQSAPLTALFSCLWLGIQSHPFMVGPGEPLTPRPRKHTSPQAPQRSHTPTTTTHYQRLSTICGRMKEEKCGSQKK